MRQSNIFTVKRYAVECNPFEPEGKQYSNAFGFGMSTSPKKAVEQANKMFWKGSNGGTPIMGECAIFKGGKLISGTWEDCDEKTFQSMLTRQKEELELERLIAEETEQAA